MIGITNRSDAENESKVDQKEVPENSPVITKGWVVCFIGDELQNRQADAQRRYETRQRKRERESRSAESSNTEPKPDANQGVDKDPTEEPSHSAEEKENGMEREENEQPTTTRATLDETGEGDKSILQTIFGFLKRSEAEKRDQSVNERVAKDGEAVPESDARPPTSTDEEFVEQAQDTLAAEEKAEGTAVSPTATCGEQDVDAQLEELECAKAFQFPESPRDASLGSVRDFDGLSPDPPDEFKSSEHATDSQASETESTKTEMDVQQKTVEAVIESIEVDRQRETQVLAKRKDMKDHRRAELEDQGPEHSDELSSDFPAIWTEKTPVIVVMSLDDFIGMQ